MRLAFPPLSLAGFLVLTPSPADATPFVEEVVDSLGSALLTDTSVGVGSDGTPHVVYMRGDVAELRHAFKEGPVWVIEVVEGSAISASYSDMVIGPDDVVHVVFFKNSRLNYAKRAGGSWTVEAVDTGVGNHGRYCSIALGPDGRPHASHYDINAGDLLYAHQLPDDSWETETVDTGGADFTGLYSSIAVDGNGRPHIAYFNDTDDQVWYAVKFGGLWNRSPVGGGSVKTAGCAIALTARGNPRVVYHDQGANQVELAVYTDGAWLEQVVLPATTLGKEFGMVVDANDLTHVVFRELGTRLRYAVQTGPSSWSLETVEEIGSQLGQEGSIALDGQGNPLLAYRESDDQVIRFVDSAVRVLSPGAGGSYFVGEEASVTWSGTGAVSVALSVDGGATYETLGSDLQGNGYTFVVPHRPTRFGRLRVHRASPPSTSYSDSLFTIDASVVLLSLSASPPETGLQGVELRWETDPQPPVLAGYRVEKGAAGGWAAASLLLREGRYRDPEGTAASRYRIYSVDRAGGEILLGETSLPVARGLALTAAPNPFRGGTAISFVTGGGPGDLLVQVLDVRGRLVRTLLREPAGPAGRRTVSWDGGDDAGAPAAGGVYLVRVVFAGEAAAMKVVLRR